MDENPKRSVNKRQAAMDSEKKWQEAFDADMMYELSLPAKNLRHKDLTTEAPSITDALTAEELMLDDKDDCTVMKNSVLHELLECLACPTCMARELKLKLGKSIHGFTESIQIWCKKCKREVFMKEIEPFQYYFRSPHVVSVKDPLSLQLDDNANKNAEELVCDVDVPDNPFSPCSMNGTFSNHESYVSDEAFNETPVKTVVTPSKSDTASKPLRPCVFCSKMQARLRQHVKTAHFNHPFVINMVRQPPRTQAKLMRQLRSEGILAENKRRLKNGRSDLLRVRNQGSGELTVCGICGGYYKKNVLWRHKSTCTGRPQLSVLTNEVETEENLISSGPRLIKGELDLTSWSGPPTANGSTKNNDVSEIDKIREILNGINHGVFSPSDNEPAIQNGVVSSHDHGIFSQSAVSPDNEADFAAHTTEKDDFDAQASEIAGFIASLVKPEVSDGLPRCEVNEDQLLFDSLPAIINGRDSSVRTSWSDSTEEEFPEVKSDSFADSEFLPCYDMYQSKRRKRSRSDFQYQFWKKEHEDRIRGYFSTMVDALKVPGKEACQEFLKNNTDINTDWVRVKYKVYNEIQKKKKRIKRNAPPSASGQQRIVTWSEE